MDEVGGSIVMTVHFLSFTKAGFKIEHSFTNTVHSWQVVALPLKFRGYNPCSGKAQVWFVL